MVIDNNSKNIIITTNKPPKEVYNLPDEQIEQFLRRIDVIEKFINDPVQELYCLKNQKSG